MRVLGFIDDLTGLYNRSGFHVCSYHLMK